MDNFDKDGYDEEAREVINSVCNRIINDYQFQIDKCHALSDSVSKVIYKNDLEIIFFWDFREAQIEFKFNRRFTNNTGVDFRRIRSKYLLYEGMKSIFNYKNEKSSKYWDSFVPKAKEKQMHDFLNDWYTIFPMLFETGDYSLISHLESYGHGNPEDMKKEFELIEGLRDNNNKNS